MKWRVRPLEHMPCAGNSPWAAGIDAVVATLEVEMLTEEAAKGLEVVVVGARKRSSMQIFIEVCIGKACMKNRAAGIVTRAMGQPERRGAVGLERKYSKCREVPGNTVRLAGIAVTFIEGVEAADAIFVASFGPPRS